MGRRRRRWREPVHVWWIAFVALLTAAMLLNSWRLALICLLVWCLYELSLIPTLCRVTTRQGTTCHELVRGRLYACTPGHQQIKNEAVWGAAGLRNPFRKAPAQDPNHDTGVVVYSPAVRAPLSQHDRLILTLAALGTVVATAGAVLGLVHS